MSCWSVSACQCTCHLAIRNSVLYKTILLQQASLMYVMKDGAMLCWVIVNRQELLFLCVV